MRKYIFMANGGRERLFHLHEDPRELSNAIAAHPEVAGKLAPSRLGPVSVRSCARLRMGTVYARLCIQGAAAETNLPVRPFARGHRIPRPPARRAVLLAGINDLHTGQGARRPHWHRGDGPAIFMPRLRTWLLFFVLATSALAQHTTSPASRRTGRLPSLCRPPPQSSDLDR